jgi:cytochrome c peroxidase
LPDFKKLPQPDQAGDRYSDEQLYALALYVYSLKPPPNPNKFDGLAQRGQKVFEREGCAGCHTPPLYTNNKLTLAEGFNPPPGAEQQYDILPVSVGTDPGLATKTRRGTGYYKVPSLKGVWYRSMFGHSGWCATLEDWFDPGRTRGDYVPTGFKPYGAKTYAVKGHPFGLNLSAEDRRALIAFLKTL